MDSAASSSKHRLDSAHARIHRSLCPRIAVLSSPDVQQVLEPNGFADLAQCLRPFEDSVEGVTVRTSQLESRQCSSFPVRFEPVAAFSAGGRESADGMEPQELRAPDERNQRPEELLDTISLHVTTNSKSWEAQHAQLDPLNADSLRRIRSEDVNNLTPWYAHSRNLILESRTVSRHESFGHPVAILLAVSNACPDPLNAFASLYAATQTHSCDMFNSRPYVDPNVLRYYVLLHDLAQSDDLEESRTLLESVKKIYGLDCCILPINSGHQKKEPDAAVSGLWAQSLSRAPLNRSTATHDGKESTTSEQATVEGRVTAKPAALFDEEDVKRLRAFVRELVAQSLIPWMERCVAHWNESIATSRKGLTGRLFGAGKKLFGQSSSKGANGAERPNWNPSGGFYWHSTLEAQTRRLADFAFTTHDYKLAAAMYDIGRKDYASDKAYKYAAGATEMFGLSHLMMMMGSTAAPIDVDSYLASSHALYRSASVDVDTLVRALRSTLLYYEAYQGLDFYKTAPSALVRTASGPGGAELDVISAMLLEQAAYASLRAGSARAPVHKWALHLAMAGHRYQQTGAKVLSRRCFDGARHVYLHHHPPPKHFFDEESSEEEAASEAGPSVTSEGWTLIQVHVEHELGTQAFRDGDAEKAVEHLLQTLRPLTPRVSGADQTDTAMFQGLQAGHLDDFCAAYDSVVALDTAASAAQVSLALPQSLIDVAHTSCRMADTTNVAPDADLSALEERFLASGFAPGTAPESLGRSQLQAVSENERMALQLRLENPLCTLLPLTDIKVRFVEGVSSSPDNVVQVGGIDDVTLEPREARDVFVDVSASRAGQFRVEEVSYKLAGRIPFSEKLIKRGPRLNQTVAQRRSAEPIYAADETLVMTVVEPCPSLSIRLSAPPPDNLGLGEEMDVVVTLTNGGGAPMAELRALPNSAECINLGQSTLHGQSPEDPQSRQRSTPNAVEEDGPHTLLAPNKTLEPGQSIEKTMTLRGAVLGVNTLQMLFVYRGLSGQHAKANWTHQVHVSPTVDVGVEVNPSPNGFAYQLAVTAVNLMQSREPIRISAVRFVSPRWKSDASALPQSCKPPGLATLHPGQPQTQFHGISEGLQDGDAESVDRMLDYTGDQLRTQLRGRDIQHDARPKPIHLWTTATGEDLTQSSFGQLHVSRFLQAARISWRRRNLAQSYPTLSDKDRARIFTLYQPEDLDVIVQWETDGEDGQAERLVRRGEVFVFGLSLGPGCNRIRTVLDEATAGGAGRSMYEETAKQKLALISCLKQSSLAAEEDPLVVDIDVDETLQADASTVPITFRVRNMSTERFARCVIDLDSAVAPEAMQRLAIERRKASWVGRLTLRTEPIPPKHTRLLRVQAMRPAPPPRSAVNATGSSDSPPEPQHQGFELGDWSIKVDVLANAPGAAASEHLPSPPLVLAQFNSGRLKSGRFIQA